MTANAMSKPTPHNLSPFGSTPVVAAVDVGVDDDEPTPQAIGASHGAAADTGVLEDTVDETFLACVPHAFAREHLLLASTRVDNRLELLIASSTSPAAVHNVGVRLGAAIHTKCVDGEALAHRIDEVYEHARKQQSDNDTGDHAHTPMSSTEMDGEIDRLLALADRDLLNTQGKGPIVKLVDAILFEALGRRASDVHVQPLESEALVRYRCDGVLHTVRTFPASLASAVISRIKVMGRMDIAERRMPQDGRTTVSIGQRAIDMRISTLPTNHGERAVIRLLDNTAHLGQFDQLGMPDNVAGPFLHCAQRSNGIILVTGPTGSGKTTTLYATLRRIGSPDVNIMTIEDPIEYELTGGGLAISQAQVNHRKGITFATGLRHILRQDPDIVMVGEIRDAETARIAIQASLTGHLVLSTLHTNDAASAVTRMIDLGVAPYLVSASLSAVLAQRLVRRRHASCTGAGCDDCFGTGYLGRIGLFELLVIDEGMRERIADRASLATLRNLGRQSGMRTLAEEGRRLVDAGVTSESEVQHVIEVVL